MVNDTLNELPSSVEDGIEALKSYLGSTNSEILVSVKPKNKDLAGFHLSLPTDYLGVDRVLYIGFGINFPQTGLNLSLYPSPGLDWPHNLYDSVCLFGIGQNPPYGDAKAIVEKTLLRLGMLLETVADKSDPALRAKEFAGEITSYWKNQLSNFNHQLILLDNPQVSGPLFVLSDPRWRPNIGESYYWLAQNSKVLQLHLGRLTGTHEAIKNPAQAAYFFQLKSFPDVKVPQIEHLEKWLLPHVESKDISHYKKWAFESSKHSLRWLVVQLPGNELMLHSFVLRDKSIKESHRITYGKRAEKRRSQSTNSIDASKLFYASTHRISRDIINSRNPAFKLRDISQKKVLMVGVGSLGSKITLELIKEGVENITLLDPDYLSDSNLGRHILGADDLGRHKALALKESINRDLPLINVEISPHYLHVQLTKEHYLDQFDMIVVTTADWWSEEQLGRLKSNGNNWHLVQGWSEPNAIVGHVLTIPSECNQDITQYFDAKGNFEHSFTNFPDKGYIQLPGCGAGFIPGGSLGLTQIAAMISNAALDLLTGEETSPMWQSWIGDTSKVTVYGGTYNGPTLPAETTATILKREWP